MYRDYDEYCGSNATVPFDEFIETENKLEEYKKFVRNLREILFNNTNQNTIVEMQELFIEAEKEKVINANNVS